MLIAIARLLELKNSRLWEQRLLTNLAQIKANVMNFFSNASQSSIFQHAVNLLEDLQRKRRNSDEVNVKNVLSDVGSTTNLFRTESPTNYIRRP